MSQEEFSSLTPDAKNFRHLLPLVGTVAHLLAALVPLTWMSMSNETTPSLGVVLLVMFYGLLPDIDTEASLIGRMFPFISRPLERQFGHRTITHSLLALFIVGAVDYLLFGDAWLVITLAYASHLLLDMIVGKTGLPLLFPLRVSFDILSLAPASAAEVVVTVILGLAVILPLMAPETSHAVANFIPTSEAEITETPVVGPPEWRATPTRVRKSGLIITFITHTPPPTPKP